MVESVDSGGGHAVLRLDTGQRLRVPAEAFGADPTGEADAHVCLSPEDVAQAAAGHGVKPLSVPVLEERLRLGKRVEETGRVRLEKRIETELRDVAMPLLREEVQVRRVPHDTVIENPDHPPEPREIDGVLIVPVIEERLVVTKQLVLTEEVHVRRLRTEEIHREQVQVRHETLDVKRVEPAD